jgi:cobalt-zinc-cadmium efflux system outer membrane protein
MTRRVDKLWRWMVAVGVVLRPLLGAAQPSPARAEPGTLAELVAELERRSPELQAARREVERRVARILPSGALPDPVVTVGYMGGLLPPFFPSAAVANAFQEFGASQEFPYPGKRALRSRIAATEAEAERWNYEDLRRRLVAELKTAYFEYVFVTRSLELIEKHKALLDELRRIAEIRFSVGQGIQQDVLKAQLEISLLLERRETLERDRRVLQARINGLLNRPPETPVSPALAVTSTPLPDLATLHRLAERQNPALGRDEQVVRRDRLALALARKERLPDFAMAFTSRRVVGGMPWMYGLEVMVKVPLYWPRKQRPLIAEAAAALESSRQMRERTVATVRAEVAAEYETAVASERLVELFSDSVLPQARLALESSLAAYQVGTVDFLTVVTNFITVLNYEVSAEAQQARYRQALARLEPLAGMEFVR